jgi:uncharacterized membrane protein YphA (DoxX/SURF4 family)
MTTRAILSRLGIHIYGIAAVVLGGAMVVWDDFAPFWHPVPLSTPHRGALAYIVGILLIAAGLAVQIRRFGKPGLVILSTIYFIFALLWLPRVVLLPRIYGTWGGLLEQFSPVAATMLAYVSLDGTTSDARVRHIGQVLFGICVVSFGLNHFFAIPVTARMVPAWIPPGQTFWAIATGVADVLAGLAILFGVVEVLAARLLTLMIILFGVLIWLPALIAEPRNHTAWTGNAINLIIAGAAWMVADVLSASKKRHARGQLSSLETAKV